MIFVPRGESDLCADQTIAVDVFGNLVKGIHDPSGQEGSGQIAYFPVRRPSIATLPIISIATEVCLKSAPDYG
jgi:hypothetical protein